MRLGRLAGFFGVFLCLVLLLGGPVRAEISQAELDSFIENSNSQYTNPGSVIGVEDVLYLAGKIGGTPGKAVETYGRIRNISPERAAREADLIIAVFNHFGSCRKPADGPTCGLAENPDLSGQIRKLGFEDQSGEILRWAGIKFARISSSYFGRPALDRRDVAGFLELIDDHPAFDRILLGIFSYNRQVEFLVPLLGGATPLNYAVLEVGGGLHTSEIEKDTALFVSALERTGQRSSDATSRAILTRTFIVGLLLSGQYSEASQTYLDFRDKGALWALPSVPEPPWYDESLDRGFRKLYALLPEAEKRAEYSSDQTYAEGLLRRYRRRIAYAKLELAGALTAAGETEAAAELLGRLSTGEQMILGMKQRQKIYFLREAMNPQFDDDNIFRIFLNPADDGRYVEIPPLIADTIAMVTGRTPGWLDVLAESEWAFRDLAGRYLSNAGYETMARYLISRPAVLRSRRETGVYEFYSDRLGQAFFEHAAHYKKRIEEIEDGRNENNRALQKKQKKMMTPTPVHVSERPVVFEERPLPEGVMPFASPSPDQHSDADEEKGENSGEVESGVPKDLKLPVHPYQVVRLEKTGEEWTLIFLSQALDPVGEVSRGGYWITKSSARGHSWETPVYLGLQQFFPYVVTPKSNLPLLKGNVLQIEVQVRELDTGSITFPPVGLRAKRRQDGLYLRFEWDALTRDADSDGLTDLAEHRMGLDPGNPDTDNDGLFDGSDSLPLTPFRPREPEESELAKEILKRILGYERQAIITSRPAGPGDGGGKATSGSDSHKGILSSALGPHPAIDPMHTTFMEADPGLFTGIRLPTRLLVYGPDAMEQIEKQYGVFFPVSVEWVFSNRAGTRHHLIWSAGWTGGKFLLLRTEDGYRMLWERRWIT